MQYLELNICITETNTNEHLSKSKPTNYLTRKKAPAATYVVCPKTGTQNEEALKQPRSNKY